MKYEIEAGRTDLRWLDENGNELEKRKRGSYLFRSDVTDEAQKLIEDNGFEEFYMRHLGTGHCETENINFAMLGLSEKHNGIVGVTLEGLAKDEIASKIVRYPPGKILYEILEESPHAFNVSTDTNISIPDFNDYQGIETYVGTLGNMKFKPNNNQKKANKQINKIMKNVYIELEPQFVKDLGSVELYFGSFDLGRKRDYVEGLKGTPSVLPKTKLEKFKELIGF